MACRLQTLLSTGSHRVAIGLSTSPSPVRPGIAGDVRIVVIERWLAIYRVTPDGVQIVRIIDGKRDLARLELPPE